MRVDIAISPPPPPPQKKEEESCAFRKVILSVYTERCAMLAPIISSGSFFNEPSSRQTQKRQQERENCSRYSPRIYLWEPSLERTLSTPFPAHAKADSCLARPNRHAATQLLPKCAFATFRRRLTIISKPAATRERSL